MGSFIILDLLPRSGTRPRLGIAASTKFGNSPERNRFKRITREAFRLNQGILPECDLVVRPRTYAKKASSFQIANEMISLLQETASRQAEPAAAAC